MVAKDPVPKPLTLQERVDRLEAVVRANNLHEPSCAALARLKETDKWRPGRCNCWLKESGLIADLYTQVASNSRRIAALEADK